jgi:hypothetical protein
MVKDLLMLLAGRDTYDAKAHSCQRERKALRTLPDHPRINAEPFPRRTASVNDEASEQGRRSFKLGVMTTWPEFAVISTGNGAPNPVKMMPRSLLTFASAMDRWRGGPACTGNDNPHSRQCIYPLTASARCLDMRHSPRLFHFPQNF